MHLHHHHHHHHHQPNRRRQSPPQSMMLVLRMVFQIRPRLYSIITPRSTLHHQSTAQYPLGRPCMLSNSNHRSPHRPIPCKPSSRRPPQIDRVTQLHRYRSTSPPLPRKRRLQWLLDDPRRRIRRPLAPRPQHHGRGMADQSVGRRGHRRVRLAADVDLGLAHAAVLRRDAVEDGLDVGAAAPPRRLA